MHRIELALIAIKNSFHAFLLQSCWEILFAANSNFEIAAIHTVMKFNSKMLNVS